MPARNSKVIKYEPTDKGTFTYPRAGITEIHTIVKSNSQAYVERGLEGRKVIILVLPE